MPVLWSPEQLREAAGQLKAKAYPPVVLWNRPGSDISSIKKIFGPSKYLEEFEANPLNDFLEQNYSMAFQEGPIAIFESNLRMTRGLKSK